MGISHFFECYSLPLAELLVRKRQNDAGHKSRIGRVESLDVTPYSEQRLWKR
jgi:hypothetical protein